MANPRKAQISRRLNAYFKSYPACIANGHCFVWKGRCVSGRQFFRNELLAGKRIEGKVED
jgi:hypothetical protein